MRLTKTKTDHYKKRDQVLHIFEIYGALNIGGSTRSLSFQSFILFAMDGQRQDCGKFPRHYFCKFIQSFKMKYMRKWKILGGCAAENFPE